MAKKKYIETPEKLWELFEAYRKNVKDNPRTKIEYVGKDGNKVTTPLVTPLTMVGFENYVFENSEIKTIDHYFSNRDNRYKEYVGICYRVLGFIKQDQIEGGMVGQYNASITQRLNGLADKRETTVTEPRVFKID